MVHIFLFPSNIDTQFFELLVMFPDPCFFFKERSRSGGLQGPAQLGQDGQSKVTGLKFSYPAAIPANIDCMVCHLWMLRLRLEIQKTAPKAKAKAKGMKRKASKVFRKAASKVHGKATRGRKPKK